VKTQRALLDAARVVFIEKGFADASIADVVHRAGSSVGSLYYHYGSKSGLFVALWQEHQAAQGEAASRAVAQAKRAGATDPLELFSAGARGFLEESWPRRDLVMLFFSDDSPPGFGVMHRRRGYQWLLQYDTLLQLSDNSFDRLYASILTALIDEGSREVAAATTRRRANKVVDTVIEYVRRLMVEGPWKPSAACASAGCFVPAPTPRRRRSNSGRRLAGRD
jgi:AcrR family transcriptional regulator